MAQYQGVDVENPAIVQAIKNALRRGYSREQVVKIVGMPGEVVEKYKREIEREPEGEKKRGLEKDRERQPR